MNQKQSKPKQEAWWQQRLRLLEIAMLTKSISYAEYRQLLELRLFFPRGCK